MIFVDVLCDSRSFQASARAVPDAVAAVLRIPPSQVAVRRIAIEGGPPGTELRVELSSEEQLYRFGAELARQITEALRQAGVEGDVWVMFRIVPLNRAFLNGERRGRGMAVME